MPRPAGTIPAAHTIPERPPHGIHPHRRPVVCLRSASIPSRRPAPHLPAPIWPGARRAAAWRDPIGIGKPHDTAALRLRVRIYSFFHLVIPEGCCQGKDALPRLLELLRRYLPPQICESRARELAIADLRIKIRPSTLPTSRAPAGKRKTTRLEIVGGENFRRRGRGD